MHSSTAVGVEPELDPTLTSKTEFLGLTETSIQKIEEKYPNFRSSKLPLIHLLVSKGDIKLIEELIKDNDFFLRALDNDGNTALMFAVLDKNLAMVKFLYEMDKYFLKITTHRNDKEATVLHLAKKIQHQEILDYLLPLAQKEEILHSHKTLQLPQTIPLEPEHFIHEDGEQKGELTPKGNALALFNLKERLRPNARVSYIRSKYSLVQEIKKFAESKDEEAFILKDNLCDAEILADEDEDVVPDAPSHHDAVKLEKHGGKIHVININPFADGNLSTWLLELIKDNSKLAPQIIFYESTLQLQSTEGISSKFALKIIEMLLRQKDLLIHHIVPTGKITCATIACVFFQPPPLLASLIESPDIRDQYIEDNKAFYDLEHVRYKYAAPWSFKDLALQPLEVNGIETPVAIPNPGGPETVFRSNLVLCDGELKKEEVRKMTSPLKRKREEEGKPGEESPLKKTRIKLTNALRKISPQNNISFFSNAATPAEPKSPEKGMGMSIDRFI